MNLRTVQKEQQNETHDYIVEGYAANWERYCLWDSENERDRVYEVFEREAFENTDMSDVIFLYNHEGRVLAAMRNDSLKLDIDDVGIHVVADLSGSDLGRSIWEDINNGLVTKMSWAFAPGEVDYEPKSRTIVHKSVRKMYDVSAVSIPANDTTTIGTRSWAEGVIEPVLEEFRKHTAARKRLELKLRLGGLNNE